MIVSNKPLICLLTLLCLISGPMHSAAQEEQHWYRVELLIFAHQSEAAQTSETWNPTPTLLYPQPARFLIDPELKAPIKLRPATPSPFILLASSERELYDKAAYMQRTGRYRILFHETWVQAMEGESSALPIIIDRSGDNEEWPQLQGSVKFFLSRYLHLETNLWLNTPGQYLPQDWQMPAAPLGPKSVTTVYPPEPELEPEPMESDYFIATEGDSLEDMGQELLEPEGPVYPWRHAVLLRQKRKMRSNEVHYIDHPMLGVVAKITPLDEEELRARAMAEAALSQQEVDTVNK